MPDLIFDDYTGWGHCSGGPMHPFGTATVGPLRNGRCFSCRRYYAGALSLIPVEDEAPVGGLSIVADAGALSEPEPDKLVELLDEIWGMLGEDDLIRADSELPPELPPNRRVR